MIKYAYCLRSTLKFSLTSPYKTARIWDFQSGETKTELRGHDNVVEIVVFAPISAYPAIQELAGIAVRQLLSFVYLY